MKLEKEFIEQINKYKGIVQKICNIYFYNDPLSEDYYQEIIIRLWKAFPGFRGESTFSTWLYRVALNSAIDIVRKKSILPVFVSLSKKVFNIPGETGPFIHEERDKLYRAIAQLPAIEKAIILLYLEGYGYHDIAEISGITENNVGVKINRIKGKLYKKLINE